MSVDELLTRGVAEILPSQDELRKILKSGKKLRVYQGFDPTSPVLHIGHMAGLRKLRQWQELGHEVIFLIGDFTGMVGDPTGKDKTREELTHEQVLENAKTYKEQAGKILRFDGENPVQIKYNGEWLAKLSAIELANLTSLLSIQQVIERDMFQKRLQNNMNIAVSEFLYPFMQGYDSVAMDVDVEIGGTDQLFNMMIGRDLLHKLKQKNKFVMTTPLLTDSQGKKIGKSEGNAIALTDSPEELFGKIMSLGDDVIVKALEYLTDVPMGEIKEIEEKIKRGINPIEYKKRLAFEIVKQLNTKDAAEKAQNTFQSVVQNKELPQNIATIEFPKEELENMTVADVLVELGMAQSKSQAKQLVTQGGVKVNGEEIQNGLLPFFEIKDSEDKALVQVGRKISYISVK